AGGGAAGGLSRGRGRAGGGGWDTPWPGGTRPPPPRPPSPPLGPPRGAYFSRRKLRQPLPPSPPRTKIVTRSTNIAGPVVGGRPAHRYRAACSSGSTLIRPPCWSNFTRPSISEKIVQSRPIETFLPARHLVPRWRQMMLPGLAYWPPNSLIPSILGFESRPLRLDP